MERRPGRAFAHPARDLSRAGLSITSPRFTGGHNVIALPAGRIAVRADRMRLGPAAGDGAVQARVVAVEYQGASVQVALEAEGFAAPGESAGVALSAVLDDATFASRPFAPGDRVALGWDAAAAHRLDA